MTDYRPFSPTRIHPSAPRSSYGLGVSLSSRFLFPGNSCATNRKRSSQTKTSRKANRASARSMSARNAVKWSTTHRSSSLFVHIEPRFLALRRIASPGCVRLGFARNRRYMRRENEDARVRRGKGRDCIRAGLAGFACSWGFMPTFIHWISSVRWIASSLLRTVWHPCHPRCLYSRVGIPVAAVVSKE